MISIVSCFENCFDLSNNYLIKNPLSHRTAKKDDFQGLLQLDQSLENLFADLKEQSFTLETPSNSSLEILKEDVDKEDTFDPLQTPVLIESNLLKALKSLDENLIEADEFKKSSLEFDDDISLFDLQPLILESPETGKNDSLKMAKNLNPFAPLKGDYRDIQEIEPYLQNPQVIEKLSQNIPQLSTIDTNHSVHFSFVGSLDKSLIEPNLSMSLIINDHDEIKENLYENEMNQLKKQNNSKLSVFSKETQKPILQNLQNNEYQQESKECVQIDESFQDLDNNKQTIQNLFSTDLMSESFVPLSSDLIPVKSHSEVSPVPLSKMMPMQQVQFHLKQSINKNTKEIVFDLHPLELGQVQVSLKLNAQHYVEAMIKTETKETCDLLQKDIETQKMILKSFEDAGWKTEEQSLQFSYQDTSSDQQAQGFYSSFESLNQLQEHDKESQDQGMHIQNFINIHRVYDALV